MPCRSCLACDVYSPHKLILLHNAPIFPNKACHGKTGCKAVPLRADSHLLVVGDALAVEVQHGVVPAASKLRTCRSVARSKDASSTAASSTRNLSPKEVSSAAAAST